MLGRTSLVNTILGRFGLRIARTRRMPVNGVYSPLFPRHKVTDLDCLTVLSAAIPGMLSEESAKFLFVLCYMQQSEGDVVEIGSWQGYSTSFLARAVAESANGRMFAIDHFKGNEGKERFYKIRESDLSDLQENFRANIERIGLASTVRLLAMANSEAAEVLNSESVRIRLLFIDGDHTEEGAQSDVALFFPLLTETAIIVFDDCAPSAPGVVKVVDKLLSRGIATRAFSYANTSVLMLG